MITKLWIVVGSKRPKSESFATVRYKGKDGEWETSGDYCDIFKVDGGFVAVNPMNSTPVACADSAENIISWVEKSAGVKLTKED